MALGVLSLDRKSIGLYRIPSIFGTRQYGEMSANTLAPGFRLYIILTVQTLAFSFESSLLRVSLVPKPD